MFGHISDEALVKRALSGKTDAWDKLIRRYEQKLFNFALRMTGNREDAMDLMQDIFLAIYKSLAGFNGTSPFGGWVFGIASRRAATFWRRHRDFDELQGEALSDNSAADPFDVLLKNQENRQVLGILAQLSPEQRLVIEMKYFQDRTFDEMAAMSGVSSNTLKTRLYAALKKIRSLKEVEHAV